jgi:hypothetical protein
VAQQAFVIPVVDYALQYVHTALSRLGLGLEQDAFAQTHKKETGLAQIQPAYTLATQLLRQLLKRQDKVERDSGKSVPEWRDKEDMY